MIDFEKLYEAHELAHKSGKRINIMVCLYDKESAVKLGLKQGEI
jgi:hypothetical protein